MHPVVFPVLRTAVAASLVVSLFELGSQTGASRFALAQVLDPAGKSLVDVGADDFVVQESGADREVLDPVRVEVAEGGQRPAEEIAVVQGSREPARGTADLLARLHGPVRVRGRSVDHRPLR